MRNANTIETVSIDILASVLCLSLVRAAEACGCVTSDELRGIRGKLCARHGAELGERVFLAGVGRADEMLRRDDRHPGGIELGSLPPLPDPDVILEDLT